MQCFLKKKPNEFGWKYNSFPNEMLVLQVLLFMKMNVNWHTTILNVNHFEPKALSNEVTQN